MKRVVLAVAAVCLGTYSVWAASPKIEAAVKTFNAVAADAGKLKTYCDMVTAMDAAGDKQDEVSEAQIAAMMKQLGPDFATAWSAGDTVEDESEDGKAYVAAIDALSDKCPQPK